MAQAADLTVFRRHGGRLAAARAAFPDAPEPWLDLSTGINPLPYPAPRASQEALTRLPDPEALAALEAAAAAVFGVEPARVAAVPGSEAALRLLPHLMAASSVSVAGDTYGGHAEAWAAADALVVDASEDADVRVVVNPNNPDGAVTPAETIRAWAEDGWLVVDEAFADAAPEVSVAAQAGGPLIVLRSFGKFYGLPGLRLGFVVADPYLVSEVRAATGDWPVSVDAIVAGQAAYADMAWAEATRARLANDAARLDALLTSAGLKIVGGTALFRLVTAADADGLFVRLAQAGILVRPFDNSDRLRFGLPGTSDAWARLEAALTGDAR